MAHILGSLPPPWETWTEFFHSRFLGPDCRLVPPQGESGAQLWRALAAAPSRPVAAFSLCPDSSSVFRLLPLLRKNVLIYLSAFFSILYTLFFFFRAPLSNKLPQKEPRDDISSPFNSKNSMFPILIYFTF